MYRPHTFQAVPTSTVPLSLEKQREVIQKLLQAFDQWASREQALYDLTTLKDSTYATKIMGHEEEEPYFRCLTSRNDAADSLFALLKEHLSPKQLTQFNEQFPHVEQATLRKYPKTSPPSRESFEACIKDLFAQTLSNSASQDEPPPYNYR